VPVSDPSPRVGELPIGSVDSAQYPSAMGPNRRAQESERAAARAAEEAKRAEAKRKAIAEAEKERKIVGIWNARQAGGRALWFYPTISAAIAAGLPWLSFSCPACGQVGAASISAPSTGTPAPRSQASSPRCRPAVLS
jgi:hypothetical protein